MLLPALGDDPAARRGTAGAAGAMSPGERFGWLTAPRRTVVQTSPVHTGVTVDPAGELDHLVEILVDRQGPPRAVSG